MLTRLKIQNYKSIDQFEFGLGKLNLFIGPNSSGKTTVLQALLLAADNISYTEGEHGLNSFHFESSSFNESRNYINNAKSYSISLTEKERDSVSLYFQPRDDKFIGTNVEQKGVFYSDTVLRLQKGVTYLPAFRIGELNGTRINQTPELNIVGLHGEYVMDYFETHKSDILPESLLFYKGNNTLQEQVNYWLKKMTGYKLATDLKGSEYSVRFVTENGKVLNPRNVGTGVSFIAEVLIVCLAAKPEQIVVVENPEIHLHPSAQADLIDFLAVIANAGIQVFVESHSDHFFNGVRRLLHNRKLLLDDVKVYSFCKKHTTDSVSHIEVVQLSQEGGVRNYIPDMFEQFDKDLDEILR